MDKTEHTVGSPLELVCTDKGFSEAEVTARLVETRPGLRERTSPKSPQLSRAKEQDPDFLRSQKRRAQTEARIAIITNIYQRGRSLSKGIGSTADFCTMLGFWGGDGGEGLAIVELVHGVMEILEGRLTLVFPSSPPLVVDPDGAAAENAEDLDGVAVAHPAGVLARSDIEPLVQPAFDAPIQPYGFQQFSGP